MEVRKKGKTEGRKKTKKQLCKVKQRRRQVSKIASQPGGKQA